LGDVAENPANTPDAPALRLQQGTMANTDATCGIDRRRLMVAAASTAAVAAATDSFVGAAFAASAFPHERRIDGLTARNLGIITAHRPDATSKENAERMAQLQAEAGWLFGLLEIRGRYVTRTGDALNDRAFLLIGREGADSGNLLGFLRSSARKFGQDGFLYKSPYEAIAVHALKCLPDLGLECGPKKQTPNRGLGQFYQSLIGEYCNLILRRGAVSLPLGRSFGADDKDWLGGYWESIGVFTSRSFFRRGSFPVSLWL
jgi:hypothetical protein